MTAADAAPLRPPQGVRPTGQRRRPVVSPSITSAKRSGSIAACPAATPDDAPLGGATVGDAAPPTPRPGLVRKVVAFARSSTLGSSGSESQLDAAGEGANSAHPGGDRVAQAVGSLADAAQENRWRIVAAGRPHQDQEEVAGPSIATVVVVDIDDVGDAHDVIRRLRAGGDAPAPGMLIAVLVAPQQAHAAVLGAHSDLLDAGADDVTLVQDTSAPRLHVEMSTLRVRALQIAAKKMKARILGACEDELLTQLEDMSRRSADFFWPYAHKVFEGMPKLSWDVKASPVVGAAIGGGVIESLLGRGAFGDVYNARVIETDEPQAVKVLDKAHIKTLDDVRSIWREIQSLRNFDHPNIVRLESAHQGPQHIILCMEHAGKANLTQVISAAGGRLTPSRSRLLMVQLLRALSYCHGRGVAHRDVKPENAVVARDGETLKLIDFGSAVPLTKSCADMAGTMPFMSPEILAAGDVEPYVPNGCDIWASGVVMLELLCGCGTLNAMLGWPPDAAPGPERSSDLKAYFQEFDAVYEMLVGSVGLVPDPMMDVFAAMFQLDPEHRCTAEKALQFEWFVEQ